MRTFVENSVDKDDQLTSSDWTANLGAQFDSLAGINVSFYDSSEQDAFNTFQAYSFDQEFYSSGGDQTITGDYNAWVASIPSSPAPFETKIGSLQDLLGPNKDFDQAFQVWYDVTCAGGSFSVCDWVFCSPLRRIPLPCLASGLSHPLPKHRRWNLQRSRWMRCRTADMQLRIRHLPGSRR